MRRYLGKTTRYVLRPWLAGQILKMKSSGDHPQEWVKMVFDVFQNGFSSHLRWSIRPSQVPEEITSLVDIVKILAPSIVLEIGTASGGTLFLWTKTASPDAMIISIDLPGGAFGGGYPKERIPYYKSFASDNQKISLLREDSHSLVTLDEVKGIIDNRKVDFLFIDGDHSYEGVKKDFEMYSGLVRKGGIVAFHDICHHVGVATCNVELFWSEIKNSYKFKEIIKDSNQEWAGIGVLYM